MQFASVFKKICKKKGLTQQQVLSDLDLNRNATQRWKECLPSSGTLQKLAKYFEMSMDELLEDVDDDKKTPTPKGERDYSDDALIEAFNNADETTKEAIRRLLKLQ